MNEEIKTYIEQQTTTDQEICNLITLTIDAELTEAQSKVWHRHPVWFLEGNPIVGFTKEKKGIRLMFWSGADFDEENLNVKGKKFKDASIFYNHIDEVNLEDLRRWLKKSGVIQWDYKNLIKRKGQLEKLF